MIRRQRDDHDQSKIIHRNGTKENALQKKKVNGTALVEEEFTKSTLEYTSKNGQLVPS